MNDLTKIFAKTVESSAIMQIFELSNSEAYEGCRIRVTPHGAGRIMSRKKAKETLDLNCYKNEMSNVYSTSVCEETIDESPMAYKPMDEIKTLIEPTVEIIETIKPIYNFKAKD